jgi:hypothetical protein
MEKVVAADSVFEHPEVTDDASDFAWSDAKPKEETIRVTVHGLRRLLRIAAKAWPFAMLQLASNADLKEMYAGEVSPEKVSEFLNELSSVWCEGELVISRLFVTDDGKAIAHSDEEIDAKGKAPWEEA